MQKLKFSKAQVPNVKRQFLRYRRFRFTHYVRYRVRLVPSCVSYSINQFHLVSLPFFSLLLHLFLFWLQHTTSAKITYLLKHEIWFIMSSSSIYHRKAYTHRQTSRAPVYNVHTFCIYMLLACVWYVYLSLFYTDKNHAEHFGLGQSKQIASPRNWVFFKFMKGFPFCIAIAWCRE